ncbi:MAG: ferredoxin [Spirochaetales bacterium]|nr:ferredoxin [Spirochaetales bacterium]
MCAELCPDTFRVEGGIVTVCCNTIDASPGYSGNNRVPYDIEVCVREAVETCPEEAIVIENGRLPFEM